MRRKRLASLAAGTLVLGATASVDLNEFIDYTAESVFIPSAVGGAGEAAVFDGRLHILLTTTLDGKGGFHAKTHFQPQGLVVIGETTGDIYRATGVTQDHFNGKVGVTYTYVNNFRMIGPGPGNNLLIHTTYHFTVNADGTVTVEHDNSSVVCK